MKNHFLLFSFSALFTFLSSTSFAQQRVVVPSFTTDDVAPSPVIAPAATPNKANSKENQKTTEPVAKNSSETPPKEAPAVPSQNPDEEVWNERLHKKQEQAKNLARQATSSELEIARLKNQIHSAVARTTREQEKFAAQLDELTLQMNRLRTEAKVAQEEVAAVLAEGVARNYKIGAGKESNDKKLSEVEKANKLRDSLQQEITDAQALIQALELRLNNNQAEVRKNGNGDNFALNRLRAEKENILSELEKTRAKIEESTRKLQTLR